MPCPRIVIDDGSHVSNDVIVSFGTLFDYVRPGGLYVVGDLQTSYWEFPADPGFVNPRSSIGFLKSLVDGLNYPEILSISNRPRQHTDEWISGIHLCHNLAFIEKNGNKVYSPAVPVIEHALAASQQAANPEPQARAARKPAPITGAGDLFLALGRVGGHRATGHGPAHPARGRERSASWRDACAPCPDLHTRDPPLAVLRRT